ncbi:MAG: hypothetical protein ABEH90_00610 [Halolamina sp.]
MADLQSCFFCGTAEDVQEYAVVPQRFTDDGPRSAALCGGCKTKLLQVIEPFTERLDSDGREGGDRTTASGAATNNDADVTAGASGSEQTEQTTDEADETGLADIVGGTDDDGSTTPDVGSGQNAGRSPSAGNNPNARGSPRAERNPDTGSRSGGSSTPPNYRRAMRMLSNREFPLDRSEVESMLAGAYDMERHEVEAVLHHATETGDLREEDGEFYRG